MLSAFEWCGANLAGRRCTNITNTVSVFSEFQNFYFTPTTVLGGLPPDPEMWYRNDWADANGANDCKAW